MKGAFSAIAERIAISQEFSDDDFTGLDLSKRRQKIRGYGDINSSVGQDSAAQPPAEDVPEKSKKDRKFLRMLIDGLFVFRDLESDQKVHDMLLALPCTVVVLAHRLHRIRSFDQVVVLDGGRVAEQGRPDELLANPQSRLAGLWKNAGLPQG